MKSRASDPGIETKMVDPDTTTYDESSSIAESQADRASAALVSREQLVQALTSAKLARGETGSASSLIPAAVLVPLIDRPGGITVLLTTRSANLTSHAGQISFPGGCVEQGDGDRAATALREAEEEIGLPRNAVELIGELPDYEVQTGFVISPVVGWIVPPVTLWLDANEVAEIFEVPLSFFLDARNHERHTHMRDGVGRDYWAMPFDGRHIWGATAGILFSLYRILQGGSHD